MTRELFLLGEAVAERGHVLPFDPLGSVFVIDRSEPGMRTFVERLLAEASLRVKQAQSGGLLPPGYDSEMFTGVHQAIVGSDWKELDRDRPIAAGGSSGRWRSRRAGFLIVSASRGLRNGVVHDDL